MRFTSYCPCPEHRDEKNHHSLAENCEFECVTHNGFQAIDVEIDYRTEPSKKEISGWKVVIESVRCCTIEIKDRLDSESIALLEEDARRDYLEEIDEHEDDYEVNGVSRKDFA